MNSISEISVVFMGTPQFAVPVLEALVKDPDIEVKAVLSQPDRKVGRRQELQAPPVKVCAEKHDIAVFQPEKDAEIAKILKDLRPDFAVVVAYGLILSQEVLELPQFGSLNVHASLLPKYRGASPIQAALMSGDETTGLAIQQMVARLDAGDVVSLKEVSIDVDDTFFELSDRLSHVAADLLVATLKDFRNGRITPQPQDEAAASYCKKLHRGDGELDFHHKTAQELYNQFRALHPWPGVFTEFNGKRLKILDATFDEGASLGPGAWEFGRKDFYIGTKKGAFVPQKIQLEGKRSMSSAEFVRGYGVV